MIFTQVFHPLFNDVFCTTECSWLDLKANINAMTGSMMGREVTVS